MGHPGCPANHVAHLHFHDAGSMMSSALDRRSCKDSRRLMVMITQLITRGRNITSAQLYLLQYMDATDVTGLISKASELVAQLPDPASSGPNRQGLMLGLVQSGKTGGLTTSIAIASDNGYRCFIVLTSDNIWLYNQTMKRLKGALPGLQIVGKDEWERETVSMARTLKLGTDGLVLVATKNATVLTKLLNALDYLQSEVGELPTGLVIDDEADQASLDTRMSRRATNPLLDPGRINDLISQIRGRFAVHAYLQVTATPQALFLQDTTNPYRPEFTVLIEPGRGYVGGNTFFSLINGQGADLIRNVAQQEVATMITSPIVFVPDSLKRALCIFYVGATIKCLQNQLANQPKPLEEMVYSLLCHISQRKNDHNKAYEAISAYFQRLREGLSSQSSPCARASVESDLSAAYADLSGTLTGPIPSFQDVVDDLAQFIVGTEIQILNSDKEQEQPSYDRRYNILIGGTKLARGVTIKNLLVTYYGRQALTTNMDTMLQHARMYGYREKDLDVTRLFVTEDVAERFRLINESEEALRDIIQRYPNEVYRGIYIGQRLHATRSNVLNPNTVGAYAAGSSYFPSRPLYRSEDVVANTSLVDGFLTPLHPQPRGSAIQVSIDKLIEILRLCQWVDPNSNGMWDDDRIVAALETLKQDPRYLNIGYLIVRRNSNVSPTRGAGQIGAVLDQDVRRLANPDYPTLFMYRLNGQRSSGWDDSPFWVPTLRFPDGRYALMFNFE